MKLSINGRTISTGCRTIREQRPNTTQVHSLLSPSSVISIQTPKSSQNMYTEKIRRKNFTTFNFDIPSNYRIINALQPSLPSRNIGANPFLAYSIFKRRQIQPNNEPLESCQVSSRQFRGKFRSQRRQLAQSMNLNEKDNNSNFVIMVALEQPKKVIGLSTNSIKDQQGKQQRPKSATQGPNFPFNLSYMLKQLNSKNKKTAKSIKISSINLTEGQQQNRGFCTRVYRKKKNDGQRQFYTDCIRQSELRDFSSKGRKELKLDLKEPKKHFQDESSKDFSLFNNILLQHQPRNDRQIVMSNIC